MSFTDEYLALQKKKKKEQLEKATGHKFTDDYNSLQKEAVLNSADYNDIAPSRPLTLAERGLTVEDVNAANKKYAERNSGWFQAGAFADGTQWYDIPAAILGTAVDAGFNVGKGILNVGERVSDLAHYGAAGVVGLFGADELSDKIKKEAQRNAVDELTADASSALDNWSVLGDKSSSVADGVGQVILIGLTGGAAGAAGAGTVGVTAATTGLMGASSMGHGMSEAYQGGASDLEALKHGLNTGATDVVSEMIFGGLGRSFKALGFGKGLTSADDILAKAASKGVKNQVAKNLVEFGIKSGAEGLEEVLAGVGQAYSKYNTYMSDEEFLDILADENLLEQFIAGSITSGIMQGGDLINANRNGTDFITGLTANEQAVVDKEIENRISEQEKDGNELTKKEKAEIENRVLNDLQKGYISTDTIEEVLGGESYKNYRDTVDAEDSIVKEFEELGNKQNPTLAEQTRYAELKQQIEDNKANSQRDQLKSQLDNDVLNLLNSERRGSGSALLESYNEKTRRGQAFQADITKYDAKQQAVVQKAIDSGILNNTNRTHEFVDIIAKISADKGVLFDFTNNAKLKESGFALNGKSVNGYITKDGITINIDSSKAWQSTVGHEVTHVLEGTELYTELQTALFDYAKSKGEYDSRLASLTELYKGVKDANVDAELTADLVGDYLFQDSNFINNLAIKNRNVFQKIYDEIKYLVKVATAGSKEARELEKVKKAFENAYRADGKTQNDTEINYSLEQIDGIDYVRAEKNIFVKEDGTTASERDVFKSLAGKTISLPDGDVEIVSGLPGKDMYNELFARRPKFFNGVGDIKQLNSDVNYNMKELLANSEMVRSSVPDYNNKHQKQGITHFDTRTVNFYDGNKAYSIQFSIGILQDGRKVAYAKKFFGYDDALTKKIQDSKTGSQKSSENQKPVSSKRLPQDSKNVKRQFSLSDSDGKNLTKEQQDYFKDSKMRDENGSLKVMYHGSQDAGFHVFDAQMSDDDTSFFFVDRNDVAASYSGTSETYEAKTIRTPEDMNNFLAEIGYDHYEAVEKNGKFELLENNEHVATKDTMQEIYEEFCWYEGVGEGDANYKVYLNLTNPLEVDAGGRNWNNISREYSQEIADRYNSLTAEEKAALTNLAEWGEYGIFRDEMLEARATAEQGGSGVFDEAYTKNLASAYEKLGGANANLYDAFSIASDNFSAESIKEFAVKQMNTRDYAKKAKAEGYDGVIFKNIVDVGGYSNGSEGASTVAIAFDSNQIKSVANEKPTGNPDIRYSLTEYTEEEKKAHNKSVVDHFGKTYKWSETGYVLLDGSRLDLSGRHEGAPGGYRSVDHRDIVDALGSDYGDDSYSGSLVQFMSEGNIRISPESNGINLSVKPNKAQEMALANFVSYARGEVLLDIDDANGYTVVSVEYPRGTHSSKVLVDIREWFDNGTKPEVSNLSQFRSLSNKGEQGKRYGDFYTPANELRFGDAAPVEEDIAPTESTTPDASVVQEETIAPTSEANDLFPDDLAPVAEELDNLYQQKDALETKMQGAIENLTKADATEQDMAAFEQISAEYDALMGKIAELEATDAERVDSLTEEDAPPEVETQYDNQADIVPLEEKDIADIAKDVRDSLGLDSKQMGGFRKLIEEYSKSENPSRERLFRYIKDNFGTYKETISDQSVSEAKKYLRTQAMYISDTIRGDIADFVDFRRTNRGKIRFSQNSNLPVDSAYQELNGLYPHLFPDSIINPTDQLLRMVDVANMNSKTKIEHPIDDNTLWGVTDDIIDYVSDLKHIRKEANANEYSKEAFDSLMQSADQYAPPVNIDKVPSSRLKPAVTDDAIAPETYDAQPKKGVADGQQAMWKEPAKETVTRKELHARKVAEIDTAMSRFGGLDKVLKNAKDLSTFSTVDNIPQRVMEKALGYKEGQVLSDLTVNKVAQNETDGIKWLNSFTDRKTGLLAKISAQYNIKPGSKKSAAAQMYAEGFYVNENNEIIQYGDKELAQDFPNIQEQRDIRGLARDSRIRQIYDETLAKINESRKRNAYPEIPRLDNYFLHFRAMDDTFSRLGLPFNPNDIKAKDLPTDLNGVTADLKPGQPYFASAMHRTGKRTSFDLLGGLERYLSSAKNQIYHIDDIQTLRALRNYIADTYGQANGLEGLDALTEEEAQEKIKQVYGSHLSTFAKFLNEEANVLAGKTALIDRGLEGIIGRRGITFLNTINQQVGKNMVGFNVSSSLTNFLPVVQTFAKTNKFDFAKAFAQTASNKIGSIFGKGDGFAESSPVIIRRKGAESFYRTPYQKVSDAGYVLMSAVDNISTELIARTKYNELTRKGMDSQKAHIETDKWVSRLMGDRSLGQQPQLYNSKMLGLFTKFQLEVRNQLDSQFYDTIQEAKVSTEHIQDGLARNAKKAAKITSTFAQLAVAQHLFGKAFEAVAGYNPAFDIIDVLIKTFGWDDDEDDEDTALDNIEEGFLALLGDLPYTSTFTGGRIPIESALPIEQFITGKDQYGNEKSRWDTFTEAAPYYLLPGGFGQIKKTTAGLSMFSDEHPIAGSYTDSGNLRFPVEDTFGNRLQAGLFGQWASQNARDYFDNEWAPLKPKQTEEFIDLDIPIDEYRSYKEDLSDLDSLEEKADYIDSLDLPVWKKNILINNLVDRKEPIDMSDYSEYGSMAEFDFANSNPEKYAFFQENGISYEDYATADEDGKRAYSWAYDNPEKYTMYKAVSGDFMTYYQRKGELYDIKADKDENGKSISGSRKEKVIDYINRMDADYGEKIILFKSEYPADDTYNYEIIDYLNSRTDISYDDTATILKELGFTVRSDGTITWD